MRGLQPFPDARARPARRAQARPGLFRSAEGAAVLCARAEGGWTPFRDVPAM